MHNPRIIANLELVDRYGQHAALYDLYTINAVTSLKIDRFEMGYADLAEQAILHKQKYLNTDAVYLSNYLNAIATTSTVEHAKKDLKRKTDEVTSLVLKDLEGNIQYSGGLLNKDFLKKFLNEDEAGRIKLCFKRLEEHLAPMLSDIKLFAKTIAKSGKLRDEWVQKFKGEYEQIKFDVEEGIKNVPEKIKNIVINSGHIISAYDHKFTMLDPQFINGYAASMPTTPLILLSSHKEMTNEIYYEEFKHSSVNYLGKLDSDINFVSGCIKDLAKNKKDIAVFLEEHGFSEKLNPLNYSLDKMPPELMVVLYDLIDKHGDEIKTLFPRSNSYVYEFAKRVDEHQAALEAGETPKTAVLIKNKKQLSDGFRQTGI